MKIFKHLPAIFILIAFLSCGDKNEDSSPTLDVTYEVFSNSFFRMPAQNVESATFIFHDQKDKFKTEKIYSSASLWTKSVRIRQDQLPFNYYLKASGTAATINGFVNLKVTVNGVVQKESQVNISNTGLGYGIFSGQVEGVIN